MQHQFRACADAGTDTWGEPIEICADCGEVNGFTLDDQCPGPRSRAWVAIEAQLLALAQRGAAQRAFEELHLAADRILRGGIGTVRVAPFARLRELAPH